MWMTVVAAAASPQQLQDGHAAPSWLWLVLRQDHGLDTKVSDLT